ncbi:MAG: sigma 54-interacting transcriptional regulator [Deltaproteobacteria bacterium]|nr:sigma 54-interacting transcriptional regulator [Deltaproteobacteria bacterium]
MVDTPLLTEPEILRAALDCMGEGMFVVGTDGKILFFSAAAESLTGIPASEAVGRPCSEALRGGVGGIDCAVPRGAARDHEDFDFVTRDGTVLRVHRTLRPLVGSNGVPRGTVVTFHLPQIRACGARTSEPRMLGSGATTGEDTLRQFVGRSLAIRKIVDTIRRVAASDTTVLITGESGTGKELVARAIHESSRRRGRQLVAVNCAAIPFDLLESELFGHVRGAFTGAVRDRKGLVETAEGGTLFLDEIGDLAIPLQAKLLRLLQEKTYQRVGDSRYQPANIRVLAATNIELEQALARGTFRQDLFYRLCVIPIRIPPLRERREDIAPLAAFLLARRSVAAGRLPMRFSREAMRLLEEARWEGNVRQLINVIDYVVALCEPSVVDARALPEEFLGAQRGREGDKRSRYQVGERGEAEALLIRTTLESQGFHRQRTADALGMDRVTLYRKIREYRIALPGSGEQDETG